MVRLGVLQKCVFAMTVECQDVCDAAANTCHRAADATDKNKSERNKGR